MKIFINKKEAYGVAEFVALIYGESLVVKILFLYIVIKPIFYERIIK